METLAPIDNQISAEEARALGFSEAELDALMAAGVLIPEERRGPWVPSTLEDLDWIISRRKQLAAERAELERWHQERLALNERAQRAFDRFDRVCEEITRAHLERKADGSFKRKSLVLPHGKAKLTSTSGGYRITDEVAVLEYAKGLNPENPDHRPLIDAVKATVSVEYQGPQALYVACDPDHFPHARFKVYADGVKAYVTSLSPTPDPETGEALPATIPGVELVPAGERWSFE